MHTARTTRGARLSTRIGRQTGLAPVDDVAKLHLHRQALARCRPTLAPWPIRDPQVFQTGAWILPDQRPLSPDLETFLGSGNRRSTSAFGSIRAPEDLSKTMIETARALGAARSCPGDGPTWRC